MDIAPYLERIRAWRPALDIRTARADPFGLNNLVIVINEEWVCRFPRSEESRLNLIREANILAVVAPNVNLSVPRFTVEESREFVAYRLLPGRPTYRHDLMRLDESLQDRFAAALAGFLRDMQSIPLETLIEAGLSHLDVPPSPALWSERLDAIRSELYPHLWGDQHAYIEDLFSPVIDGCLDMAVYSPALIHNDLASYHLLSDPATGCLTGVLDFGEATWGDPAADYAILINTYGESLLGRMTRYDPAIATLLDRARFRAAYIELEWALKGVRTNNPEWFLVHLGRARDSQPISRK